MEERGKNEEKVENPDDHTHPQGFLRETIGKRKTGHPETYQILLECFQKFSWKLLNWML